MSRLGLRLILHYSEYAQESTNNRLLCLSEALSWEFYRMVKNFFFFNSSHGYLFELDKLPVLLTSTRTFKTRHTAHGGGVVFKSFDMFVPLVCKFRNRKWVTKEITSLKLRELQRKTLQSKVTSWRNVTGLHSHEMRALLRTLPQRQKWCLRH